MGNAIIYIRFSTSQQEQGDSRRRQLEDCERYCEQHGLTVVERVEDLGRSAYKGDHLAMGNLGKLTQRIVSGQIPVGTTIVVEKMDRLSREKPRIIRRWIEDVCDRGLRIARISGGPVIDAAYLDDGANMVAVIDMAYSNNAAHEFSQNISDRLTKSWEARRRRSLTGEALLTASTPRWLTTVGEWAGKSAPDHRSFKLVPERAAVVLKIYQLAAEGMGSWGIARTLNELGTPNWGKAAETSTKAGWNHTTVLNILNSPAVEGLHYPTRQDGKKRVRTGDVLRDYFPMIDGMTADLIARARAQMTKRVGGGPRSNSAKNLIASLARCGSCGGFMVLRTRSAKEGPYSYLQCDNAAKAKECEAKGMFNYRRLEPALLDAVLHLTLDHSFFVMADKTGPLRIQLAEIDRDLLTKRDERDNTRALLRRFPDDDQLVGDWQRLSDDVRTIEQQRVEVAASLAEANGAVSDAEHLRRVHNFRVALDDENEEVRRTARLRVRDAFRTFITQVQCNQRVADDGDVEKWINVALMNGLVAYRFDNDGNGTLLNDFRDSPDHVHGLTSGVMADAREAVASVLSRSNSAAP